MITPHIVHIILGLQEESGQWLWRTMGSKHLRWGSTHTNGWKFAHLWASYSTCCACNIKGILTTVVGLHGWWAFLIGGGSRYTCTLLTKAWMVSHDIFHIIGSHIVHIMSRIWDPSGPWMWGYMGGEFFWGGDSRSTSLECRSDFTKWVGRPHLPFTTVYTPSDVVHCISNIFLITSYFSLQCRLKFTSGSSHWDTSNCIAHTIRLCRKALSISVKQWYHSNMLTCNLMTKLSDFMFMYCGKQS